MRAGILGFLHESNTFLETPTRFEDFEAMAMTEGDATRDRWAAAYHELGGFFAGCDANGLEAVPGFATVAVPSGAIEAEDFERIASRLVDSALSMKTDGYLVALHGATVARNHPDADGEILSRLRQKLGPDVPIVVTLDLHANVSDRMVALATAIVGYRTNPHLDQRDRGREAAALLARILRDGLKPKMFLASPTMLVPIAAQKTSEMFLFRALEEVLQWPGILSATIFLGFYFADVPEMGTSFLAVAVDEATARRAARYLADLAWTRRRELVPELATPQQAVRRTARPLILLDIGDNTGGGSGARSRILLDECFRQGVENALIVLYEPELAALCRVGEPVDLGFARGVTRLLADGRFTEPEIRHGGWTHCDQGLTAVVETPERHTIVLTSRRMAPMSLRQLLSLGIDPARKDVIIVKGVIAPQAAYAPIGGEMVLVDTPGPTANDPRSFAYKHRRNPLFPLEDSE
ncbi:MAG: M81 family metallopeptidase [Acidobacteria bacterium]|nr:M81 family metallopeptidase [Acidobacteriota bacterium]